MLNSSNNVLVIGDIMLDQYICGEVTRISPEAPVPVVTQKEFYDTLGGAANVANNLSALGCKTALLGYIGNDYAGKKIMKQLVQKKIDNNGIIIQDGAKTITKTRIIGNEQQIMRLDCNDKVMVTEEEMDKLLKSFTELFEEYDVLVLSDYNKGTCTKRICETAIKEFKAKGKIVIVDPKGIDWGKYSKADFITPNLKELSEFLGITLPNCDQKIFQACKKLPQSLKHLHILITRSEKGISIFSSNGTFKTYPSRAREVYDVSGAGDTVVAVLAAYYKDNSSLGTLIEMANIAAGINIGKTGTATVSPEEIKKGLFGCTQNKIESKILSLQDAQRCIDDWHKKAEVVVFTNGCFDIIHKGHIQTIYAAAEYGEHLIVAINSDASVKRIKGKGRPINNEYDRALIIASLSCVDSVVIFDENTPEEILKALRPDILVKGGDYQPGKVLGREYVKEVKIVNYIDGYSTTYLISKM